jgi:cell division initiation protein
MKISPLDIRKQTFRKALRGVDEQEVASFLEMVANHVEEIVQENRVLKDRIATSDIQLENYRRIEEALRNALVTAEKVARDTKKNADQEVEIRLKDADLRSQRAVQSARGILENIRGQLAELTTQRRDFIARYRMLVETQLKMLDLKIVEYEGEEDLRRLEEIQRALFDDFHGEWGAPSAEHGTGRGAGPALPAGERAEEPAVPEKPGAPGEPM